MGKKPRTLRRRRSRKKKRYLKVLIVCEGKKTEPNYFRGLKDYLKLSSAKVKIVGAGCKPREIVEQAEHRRKQEQGKGDPFEIVFCVFDKDERPNYKKAVDAASKYHLEVIYSVPCFEYWLLLHYKYTRSPGVADDVLSLLKRYLPAYNKGEEDIFKHFQDKLEYAKENAAKSLKDAESLKHARSADADNPSTKVHILVRYLQNIKKR